MTDGIFEQYPSASWSVAGQQVAFPVIEIDEGGGNRIIFHERPYRDFDKLDDTGAESPEWTLTAIFDNGLQTLPSQEPGLSEVNGGKRLYPDVLNEMIRMFREHETGDLVVPTVGPVRARAVNYRRVERNAKRDHAEVKFIFKLDNEDRVDAAAFQLPSVSSNAQSIAEAAEFAEQSEDMWDGSLADLNELSAELEGIANAPGDFKQDLESQAHIVQGAVDRAVSAWSDALTDGRDVLLDADGEKVERKLQAQKELAGQATSKAASGRPATLTRVYENTLSILQVAVLEQQDAATLMTINPQIADMLAIPAGTGVRILADG
jgi:prophage DNA circulation protein